MIQDVNLDIQQFMMYIKHILNDDVYLIIMKH